MATGLEFWFEHWFLSSFPIFTDASMNFWETIRTQKPDVSSLAYLWGSFSFYLFYFFSFWKKMNFTENENLKEHSILFLKNWSTFLALLIYLYYYNQYNIDMVGFLFSVVLSNLEHFPLSGSILCVCFLFTPLFKRTHPPLASRGRVHES